MGRKNHHGYDTAELDTLIEEIIVDAYGDDEQLWAFRQIFEDNVSLPTDGVVIGEPVTVLEIDYDGNERRGLTATCRREDGSPWVIALADVAFPKGSTGARYAAAYRRWLGLDPCPAEAPAAPSRRTCRRTAGDDDIHLGGPVECVVLSVRDRTASVRPLGSSRVVTLRAGGLWNLVPGEIVTVSPRKQWRYRSRPYLSGDIASVRFDTAALGLAPLRLSSMGMWDPTQDYWGEEDEPIEDWATPIVARGPRPAFEMEQVLPGADPEDPSSDPIVEANERKETGDWRGARKILMDLCHADLRCLDAHAHLGNLAFDLNPDIAIRHYEVGLRIGELSLGDGFHGLLPWGHIDNRPFLRCLHGYGLCLWRLGRFAEAGRVFERMLWLNPSDEQGARFLIEDVRDGAAWEDRGD